MCKISTKNTSQFDQNLSEVAFIQAIQYALLSKGIFLCPVHFIFRFLVKVTKNEKISYPVCLSAFCQKMTADCEWTRQKLQLGSTRNLKSIMHFSLNLEVKNFKSFYNGVWIIMPKPFVFPSGSAINGSHKARAEISFISAENLILMKEISKKCSTDQRFILKEITS